MSYQDEDMGSLSEEISIQDLLGFLVQKLEEKPDGAVGASCAKFKAAGGRVIVMVVADPTATVDMVVHALNTQIQAITTVEDPDATHQAPETIQ